MFNCVALTRKNLNVFKYLNTSRTQFNTLNKDFFEVYNSSNFAQQIFLRKTVFLLKRSADEYCGYIWITKEDRGIYSIDSLYVSNELEDTFACYKALLSKINQSSKYKFLCHDNLFNNMILNKLGFKIVQGTIELKYDLHSNIINFTTPDNITFEKFIRGQHELLRCKIQNNAFHSNGRIPLTVEDIYYDETQDYYIANCAIFIKENNKHIGYGQVILEDSGPVIVNLGILSEYRGKKYGRYLLLYLLKIIRECGYENAIIRVNSTNLIALNLYKDVGFKEISYKYLWELNN